MAQNITFRRLNMDDATELAQAKGIYNAKYPWAAELDWANVWIRLDGSKITGMLNVQMRVLVGLLDADTPANAFAMIERTDAFLAGMGVNQYECLVPNANERMQKALEKHYGLEPAPELPQKLYVIKRG